MQSDRRSRPESPAREVARDGKLPYRPPELVRYGTIGDLTRGGEGTMPDGGGGGFDFTGAEP